MGPKEKRSNRKRPRATSTDDLPPTTKPKRANGRITPKQLSDKKSNTKSIVKSEQKGSSCSAPKQKHDCAKSNNNTNGVNYESLENDIFSKILLSKQSIRLPAKCQGLVNLPPWHYQQDKSLIHSLIRLNIGSRNPTSIVKKASLSPVVDIVSNLQLYRTASPFDRRCTSMEWHPTKLNTLAVGSKSGDIILMNTEDLGNELFIQGKAAGLAITGMKFWPGEDNVVTSSVDGTVTKQDFSGRQTQVLLDTMDMEHFWYCSVDIGSKMKQLVAGDNVGNITLLSMEGKQIFKQKLHKQKVNHTEWSPRESWLLVTASTDYTVKIWDIRMLKDKNSCLDELKHEKPVNSAYFSLTDGCRLLTTDQHHELHVYNTTTWQLERKIEHPHRFFQHLTGIKAHWHPLQDLIVVGRYPDANVSCSSANDRRTIDVFDADSGQLVSQLLDPSAGGIVSLNKFCPQGDILASCMGVNILIWRRKEQLAEQQAALMKSLTNVPTNESQTSNRSNRPSRPPKQSKDKNTKKKETGTQKNLKMKMNKK